MSEKGVLEAGEVLPPIEGFPLLRNLLDLNDPWKGNVLKLKNKIFPDPLEMGLGSEDHPLLFLDPYRADKPGMKVWDWHACETDYYVFDQARPVIKMHLGRPPSCRVYHDVPFHAPAAMREEIPARIEKVIEGLKPYGAGLPAPREYDTQAEDTVEKAFSPLAHPWV